MSDTIEFPVTGLIVKPETNIKLNFIGEVDSLFYTMMEVYKKLNRSKLELYLHYYEDVYQKKAEGMFLGNEEDNSFDLHYFLKKQKNLQDYLFVAGHEEGHAIGRTNHRLEFEAALSKYAHIDTQTLDKEVFSNLVGFYALSREGFKLKDISQEFLKYQHVQDAIKLFEMGKLLKHASDYRGNIIQSFYSG